MVFIRPSTIDMSVIDYEFSYYNRKVVISFRRKDERRIYHDVKVVKCFVTCVTVTSVGTYKIRESYFVNLCR